MFGAWLDGGKHVEFLGAQLIDIDVGFWAGDFGFWIVLVGFRLIFVTWAPTWRYGL